MTEPEDKPDERLEGMLERWGADQAAREALVPPAPVALRRKGSRLTTIVYWVSTAVAAGILVAVALQYLSPQYLGTSPQGESADRQPAAQSPSGAPLRRRVDKAEEAVDAANAARADAEAKLADAITRAERAENQVAYLQRTQTAQAEKLAELRDRLAATVGKQEEADAEMKLLAARLREAEGNVETLTKARDMLKEDLKNLPQRLATATAELQRVRKMHDQALASAKKDEAELLMLKARRARLLADVQKAYLPAAAEGRQGLSARQTAAKRAKMVQRLAQVRPLVQREPTKQLLDKLEVAFLRLSMLNANEPSSSASFARLVGGGLVEEIDEALARPQASETRAWLLEALLILQGADRVG